MYHCKNKDGFGSLLGLLLSAIIFGILFYVAFTIYFKNPIVNPETEKMITQQGADVSSYTNVYNGLIHQIREVEQQQIRDSENLVERYQGMIGEGER